MIGLLEVFLGDGDHTITIMGIMVIITDILIIITHLTIVTTVIMVQEIMGMQMVQDDAVTLLTIIRDDIQTEEVHCDHLELLQEEHHVQLRQDEVHQGQQRQEVHLGQEQQHQEVHQGLRHV